LDEIDAESQTGKMYVSPFKDKYGRAIIYMKPALDNTTEPISKVRYLVLMVEDVCSCA
jgi:hypothetical protein